jgi:hypothetical protein
MKKEMEKMAESAAKLHQECIHSARRTVIMMVELGKLLEQARKSFENNGWLEWLDKTNIPRRSAYKYIEVAHIHDKKTKLLAEGKPVIDLMRDPAFECIVPLDGGGYRSEAYQRRKLLAAQGKQLYFEFDAFQTSLIALERSVPALRAGALDVEKLESLEARLEKSLTAVRDAKAELTAGPAEFTTEAQRHGGDAKKNLGRAEI